VNLYGLMITKDDHEIFADWCREHLPLFDAVVCLDGSNDGKTQQLASAFPDRLIYLHERDFRIEHKTDHGLRRMVHREIVRRFGVDNWIMCCHADEFCYHDPRKIALKAAQESYDSVSWFNLHFLPHPDDLSQWEEVRLRPITERFRYYHWGHPSTGLPWVEFRLYRNSTQIGWDRSTHGSTEPHGLTRPAPFHPILRHLKVFTTDLEWYEDGGHGTYYRKHWQGLEHRTGLPFQVLRFEDLFVSTYQEYRHCDCFDGTFRQPWNMGEEYRP